LRWKGRPRGVWVKGREMMEVWFGPGRESVRQARWKEVGVVGVRERRSY
jgi:hypothetical protein